MNINLNDNAVMAVFFFSVTIIIWAMLYYCRRDEKTYDKKIIQFDIKNILKSGLSREDLIKEIKEYFYI